MRLSELLQGIAIKQRIGCADPQITGISFDSRRVSAGEVFCCFVGLQSDGHLYAKAAVEKGAVALICEHRVEDIPEQVVQIIVEDARSAMARTSGNFFGNPARSMCIVGVTGTNGKTTVTHMLKSIGEAFGKKVGMIGTNYTIIDQIVIEANATTPDPFELHGLLRRMLDAGIQWVFMEVSAHALWLRKVDGIVFDVGVFTNFTQDHLNDFRTMDAYYAAKCKLFAPGVCKRAVISHDDPALRQFAAERTMPTLTFGRQEGAGVQITRLDLHPADVCMRLQEGDRGADVAVSIPGHFTALNAAAAAAAMRQLDVPWPVIRYGLMQLQGVVGRMQTIPSPRGSFIVDYACTPDAIENVLDAARGFTRGRLCIVFGCGGDRDREKRPLMGAAAARKADVVVLTSDNPRSEDPQDIIDQIRAGIPADKPVTCIADRAEALKWAADWAQDGDVVLIEGKGHESYQEIDGVRIPFSDAEELKRLFAARQI